MERRSCAPGSRWDSLINHCVSHNALGMAPSEAPPPVLKLVFSTRAPDESWSIISPGMWICVGMVASGSVLVLLLWFIIYRRHSRTSLSTGEKDSAPQTPTTMQQEEEAVSAWSHFNSQTQDAPISAGACGRSLCNGWAEHGLPLPATELGDSALVTAKTGRPVEV